MQKEDQNINLVHAAYYAWTNADRLWHLMLVTEFGKRAGDVRYQIEGKGAQGSALRAAHDAFVAAGKAYTLIKDATAPLTKTFAGSVESHGEFHTVL